jgi:hypothetical protein
MFYTRPALMPMTAKPVAIGFGAVMFIIGVFSVPTQPTGGHGIAVTQYASQTASSV